MSESLTYGAICRLKRLRVGALNAIFFNVVIEMLPANIQAPSRLRGIKTCIHQDRSNQALNHFLTSLLKTLLGGGIGHDHHVEFSILRPQCFLKLTEKNRPLQGRLHLRLAEGLGRGIKGPSSTQEGKASSWP